MPAVSPVPPTSRLSTPVSGSEAGLAASVDGVQAAPQRWRTRPDIWRADALGTAPVRVCATGHAALDAVLPGGGWPLGALVEVLQRAPTQALWRLLAPALSALDGAVVLVGAPLPPFAPALEAQGIAAQRLLWVRARTPVERAWAARQALGCAEVGAVLLWLHGPLFAGAAGDGAAEDAVAMPVPTPPSASPQPPRARRVAEPPSEALLLRRLHLAAQGSGRLLVALRPEAAQAAPSCAVLRLAVQAEGDERLRVQLLKRRGPPLAEPLGLPRFPARLQALLAAQPVYRARLRAGMARGAVTAPTPTPASAPMPTPAAAPATESLPASVSAGPGGSPQPLALA
jgi:protein ImuA